jgi:hypothetical protein
MVARIVFFDRAEDFTSSSFVPSRAYKRNVIPQLRAGKYLEVKRAKKLFEVKLE